MARIARPKASSRVNEMKMPPTSSVGMATRTERWSVDQSRVAKDCTKKSSPPVARSWLIGGLARIGVMIRRCTSTPSSAPTPMAPRPASQSGQP